MFRNILWDLDGTIVETGEKIKECLRITFTDMQMPIPSEEVLRSFIGPPLIESFQKVCADRETALSVREVYRKHYQEIGLVGVQPYPGVAECLRELQQKGYRNFLATSRAIRTTKIILQDIGVYSYFDGIGAVFPEAPEARKEDVIQWVLDTYHLAPEETLMVGDRLYDIEGAKMNGIRVAAVLYGYGSRQEFTEYQADYIIETVEELKRFIQGADA